MKTNLRLPVTRALFAVVTVLGLVGAAAGGATASTNAKQALAIAAAKKPTPAALITADCRASVLNPLVSSHLGVSVTFTSIGKVAKTGGCQASANGVMSLGIFEGASTRAKWTSGVLQVSAQEAAVLKASSFCPSPAPGEMLSGLGAGAYAINSPCPGMSGGDPVDLFVRTAKISYVITAFAPTITLAEEQGLIRYFIKTFG